LSLDLSSTPVRLRALGVVLACAAIVAAVVMVSAIDSRDSAARAVATRSGRLMVQAERLYAVLSDADAAADATLMTSGIASRERYLAAIQTASARIGVLTRATSGASRAGAAVSAVAAALPLYNGWVETATSNYSQGFPLGAAYYVWGASGVMRGQLLPAAQRLYAIEAENLAGDYRSGTSAGAVVAFAVFGVLLFVVFAAAQVLLARWMHRVFNVPMVIGTAVVLAVVTLGLVGVITEQDALGSAQRDGSDSVQLLSAARILALREQGDESLALIASGSGTQYLADFAAVSRDLGSVHGSGLLGGAWTLAKRSGSTAGIERISDDFSRYDTIHAHLLADEQAGQWQNADVLAVGPNAPEAVRADNLNTELVQQINAAQSRFSRHAASASSALAGFGLAIPLLIAAGTLLGLAGLRQRIKEYR
jgi:hypothetical protein